MKNLFLQYNAYSEQFLLSEGISLDRSRGTWFPSVTPYREILDKINSKRKSSLYVSSEVPKEVFSQLEKSLKQTKVTLEQIE